MSGYTTARDNALQQLLDWSRDNLRKRDQIGVIDFAGNAAVRQSPTSAKKTVQIGASSPLLFAGSNYQPVLEQLAAFPKTSCKTALVLLSDGDLQDLPADSSAGQQTLRTSGIDFQRLLIPDATATAPQTWQTAFPVRGKGVNVDGLDADDTARVIAETVATIVDTKLVRN
jgi:hypothetical protein